MQPLGFVLWMGGAAPAAEPSPEVVALSTAIEEANAGDRKSAIKGLDAWLKHHPDSVDAHVLRGINRHLQGDEVGARQDLAWAFRDEQLTVTEFTTQNFTTVETATTRVDLTDQRIVGAATLAGIESRAGDAAAALALVARARAVFGDDARLRAAEARALLASGASEQAWTTLALARQSPDLTGFTRSVTSEMAALDPAHAPPDVFASLEAAGQWTAFYNRARGALGQKDYAGCVAAVRDGLTPPFEPGLLALGYTCAARSDPTTAAQWLGELGGASKAEPADVLAHATLLGPTDPGLALLGQLPKKLPADLARTRQTMLLEGLLKLGRLDDALAASDKRTAPASETRLAHALIEAKRTKEALAILEVACPALVDDPARPACDQLLTWARSQ